MAFAGARSTIADESTGLEDESRRDSVQEESASGYELDGS